MGTHEGANGDGIEHQDARATTQLDEWNSQTQLSADGSTLVAGSALASTLED